MPTVEFLRQLAARFFDATDIVERELLDKLLRHYEGAR